MEELKTKQVTDLIKEHYLKQKDYVIRSLGDNGVIPDTTIEEIYEKARSNELDPSISQTLNNIKRGLDELNNNLVIAVNRQPEMLNEEINLDGDLAEIIRKNNFYWLEDINSYIAKSIYRYVDSNGKLSPSFENVLFEVKYRINKDLDELIYYIEKEIKFMLARYGKEMVEEVLANAQALNNQSASEGNTVSQNAEMFKTGVETEYVDNSSVQDNAAAFKTDGDYLPPILDIPVEDNAAAFKTDIDPSYMEELPGNLLR